MLRERQQPSWMQSRSRMRNAKKVEPARYRKLLEGIDLRSLTTTRAFCFGPPSSASRCYALMAVSHSRIGLLASRIAFDALQNDFWKNILQRAIEWQILTEASLLDSADQALFTVQMLLELLLFVLLVEDAMVLGEDGYSKLPASDRISLLCSRSSQGVLVQNAHHKELEAFCRANSITTIGELIAALRNKLIHPTKKNRQYLDQVPEGIRRLAVYLGLQIASLTMTPWMTPLKRFPGPSTAWSTNLRKIARDRRRPAPLGGAPDVDFTSGCLFLVRTI